MWQNHIDYIYNQIIKFVGIFYRIRHKLNFEMAKMVYFAFVHSHLIYGIEIYGNTYKKQLSKLMILNNKIFRLLQKAPIDTRITQLYTNFNTMPLLDLRKFQILKFVHKFIHHQDQLPSVYSYCIFHSYNTSTKDALHSLSFRTSLGQRSITYKGAILWNALPEELKGIVSATKFS